MNGKKAKKLRRIAKEISAVVQAEALREEVLSADPKRVYNELKIVAKSMHNIQSNKR